MYILICTHVDLRLLVQTNGAVSITIGVKIVEKVTVDKVLVSNDRVCGVRTNQGDVKCEVFVNCAGQVLYTLKWLQCYLCVSSDSGQEI